LSEIEKCPSEEMLLKLAENELDEREANLVNEHLRSCESCRNLLEEYRETLRQLAKDRISEPTEAEWRWFKVALRARLRATRRGAYSSKAVWRPRPRRVAFPAWVRGGVVVAAAALVVLVLLYTGIIDVGGLDTIIRGGTTRLQEARPQGNRYATGERTLPGSETTPAEERPTGGEQTSPESAGEPLLSGIVPLDLDSTSLEVAGLNSDELYELYELSTSSSVLDDDDVLLADLNEEEQAELLKKLESSFSM